MKRVQSPSSINTYKQCPRKYYYQYIIKLPTSGNIHTIRGNIAHTVLEDFYDVDVSSVDFSNFEGFFKKKMQNMLFEEWGKHKEEIEEMVGSKDKAIFYFEETLMMLFNWLQHFIREVKEKNDGEKSFQELFKQLTPEREGSYKSMKYSVRGYIDRVDLVDGKIMVVDYKTSSRYKLSNDYKLQLAIYSLLYYEKHGKIPDEVGLFFLRFQPLMIPANQELIDYAIQEVEFVHEQTQYKEIEYYPRKTSPLCKYSTGQCPFYDVCNGNMCPEKYKEIMGVKDDKNNPRNEKNDDSSKKEQVKKCESLIEKRPQSHFTNGQTTFR